MYTYLVGVHCLLKCVAGVQRAVLCHETLKTRNFRSSKVLEIRKFDFRRILLFVTNNNR